MPMFDGHHALLIARPQFAFTVSFHFLSRTFLSGLASFLAVLGAVAYVARLWLTL